MKYLFGKVAMITGGAGGIGLGLARAFAGAGMKVVLTDFDAARLGNARSALLGEGLDLAAIALDVTDPQSWETGVRQIESEIGDVAVLINNAGIGGGSFVDQEDIGRWRLVVEVNLFGTFHGCHTVLPRMLARNQPAHIVNIASLSGLRSNPGMSSYTASKHAIVGLTDTLRQELAGTEVGVSLVYPGMVRTEFVVNSEKALAAFAHGNAPSSAAAIAAMQAGGMDPNHVGLRVCQAVKAGEYHVFTHADWKPVIAATFADRLDAFGANADPLYHEDITGLMAAIEAGNR